MALDAASIVGALASVASVTSFAPQAWKIIKTRDVKGLSPVMYSISVAGFALWTTYGLLLGKWPIIATNALCLVVAGFILLLVLVPRRTRDRVADAVDPTR